MKLKGSLPYSKKLATRPIMSQINPIHVPFHFLKIHLILFSHLRLGLPSGPFHSGFPNTLHTPLLSPMRTTCSAHLIFLYLITRIAFGDEYVS